MTQDELRDLLPERDVAFLIERGWPEVITVLQVGAEIHVIFKSYPLPAQFYDRGTTDLVVKLIPPYPNDNPDMFWTLPHVRLHNGQYPINCTEMQVLGGAHGDVKWQRWSRHYGDKGTWRHGFDGLRTYMASVRVEIDKGR